jgi:arylsulfatase A-like enzyme
LDEQMGRLRDELKTLGVADNTMVWFSSDNGPENNTPGTAGNLRARKRSLHEGGIRVPGLLTWPSKIKSPTTVAAPCHTGDYYPTVLSVVGESYREQLLDGIDLMPIVSGDRSTRGKLIHFQFGKQATVVGDRYKLYRAQPKQAWQLFDLANDQSESKDIAGQQESVVQAMRSSYQRWNESLAN